LERWPALLVPGQRTHGPISATGNLHIRRRFEVPSDQTQDLVEVAAAGSAHFDKSEKASHAMSDSKEVKRVIETETSFDNVSCPK
jgi:hypothetical protein